MAQDLKSKTVSGVAWSAIERFSVQGIQFVIQIIMARLLLPSDYGMIGMLAIFLQISNILIDSGFSDALVQSKKRSAVDFSTVFYFNIVIAVVIYIVIYFSAPAIADFYHMPGLTEVTRYMFLNLILMSFSAVHRTILKIRIDFKTQSKVSLIAVCISGSLGILAAYQGWGVWALVIQSLAQALLVSVLSFVFVKWKPLWAFSVASFKRLFTFGSNLLLTQLLHNIYYNLYTLVIGRKFSATELGYFSRADQLATFPSLNINAIISRVTFPILSSIQDDDVRLNHAYRQYIRLASYVIFPMMVGLIVVAHPLVVLLLTEKWEPCVVLLQILCLDWMLDHLSQINQNLLLVKGRSDWAFKLEIVKKAIAISILFASIPFGVIGICWGKVLYSVIATYLNTHYTERLIGLKLREQIRDILPSLLLAFTMGGVTYTLMQLIDNYYLQIVFSAIFGMVFYVALSYLFKFSELQTFLGFVKMGKKNH